MDEAVSNLDAENERAPQATMGRAAHGRTTLLTAGQRGGLIGM
ncbi:MAG: hypothetical protein ACRDS1_04370 [Pseudonocardiaceae bacterium]